MKSDERFVKLVKLFDHEKSVLLSEDERAKWAAVVRSNGSGAKDE